MAESHSQSGVASRLVLSVEGADASDGDAEGTESEWIRERVQEPAYVTYLKRIHGGPIAVGDEWEEFVSRGCGSPRDVVLRVERIEGGDELGPDTEIEFRPRQDVDPA